MFTIMLLSDVYGTQRGNFKLIKVVYCNQIQ